MKAPKLLPALEKIERQNPEGARFEAAMFAIMRESYGFDVTIQGGTGGGGPDFLCRSGSGEFVVEVTVLDTQSVEQVSRLPNNVRNGEARFFAALTNKVRTKASDKARQVSGYSMPRVLAVGLFHSASLTLFSKVNVEWFLISEPEITVSVADAEARPHQETDLKDAVFFRADATSGKVVPCRQSISAILFVSVGNRECDFYGILHPEPHQYPFNYRLLPDIPFCRIANWPLALGSRVETEWVIADPKPGRNWLRKVRLRNHELRHLG